MTVMYASAEKQVYQQMTTFSFLFDRYILMCVFQGRFVAKTVESVSRTAGRVMVWVIAMTTLTKATAVSMQLFVVSEQNSLL